MQTGPWWSRFTALQLAISTVALAAVVVGIWVSAAGDLQLVAVRCSIAYLVVMAAWPTRRVARALAAHLKARSSGKTDEFGHTGRVFEATILPIYCAGVLLALAVVTIDVFEAQPGMSLREWFGTLSYVGVGLLGMIASAVALLCIWRRRRRAGWIAVSVAQVIGAAVVVAGFRLGVAALRPADKHDTWYLWHASPPILWLVFLVICALLGLLAIARLWRLLENEGRVPWATLVFLAVFIGYLAGFGRVTGFWLSSWLYGAFMMARILTYVFFLFEPKDRPAWRSSWFACGLVALVMCIAATGQTMMTGNFAMMTQPVLMMPIPPIAMSGSPWGFGPSLMLTSTRDLLFLLLLARLRPGWGEAVGVLLLFLLYEPIAWGLAVLGWGFLFPVLYPLSVAGPVDLLWPLAMIGLLVALLMRSRGDLSETNSLA